MSLKCGIVGLPNVGKSTLFNALTQSGIEAANYPFCTIEPNVGIVEVPDPRMAELAKIVNPQKCSLPSSNLSTLPVWSQVRAKAKVWATSSSPTSARLTRLLTSYVALTTTTSSMSQAKSIRLPTSKPSAPSWHWPTWPASKKPSSAKKNAPAQATKTRKNWSNCAKNCCRIWTKANLSAPSVWTRKNLPCSSRCSC